MKLIHQHNMYKLEFSHDTEMLRDPERMEEFLSVLITEVLGMVICIPPRVVRVEDPGNLGCTGSANLTTSHVAFHHWEASDVNGSPFMMLDIYSCKCYDTDAVLDYLGICFPTLLRVRSVQVDRSDVLLYNREDFYD